MNFDWRECLNRHVLLPLSEARNGCKTSRYTNEIMQLFGSSAAQIAEFQLGRLRKVCKYAFEYSEFYRRRIAEAEIFDLDKMSFEEFCRIPITTKQDIRESVSLMIAQGFTEQELRQTATGGTTNSPTTFYMDWETYDKRWASSNVQDQWMERKPGIRQVFLWGAPQDMIAPRTWKGRLRSYLSNSIFLPSTPLDDEILLKYFGIIKRFRPRHLQAYSTPLVIFSEFLLRNKLSLDVPSIAVTAEPVTPSDLDKIELAFGSRPFQWYGARELGRIGTECQIRNGMHLNVYSHYVEFDQNNRYIGGEMGDALITDLWNIGMPLLRYQIQDVICLDTTPCECGMRTPRLTAVLGRVGDTFINSKRQKIPGVSLTNRIIKDSRCASEMQIIQTGLRKFTIRVVPGPDFSRDYVQLLERQIEEFMNESVDVAVEQVEAIEREGSGKVRFCKCLL